MTIVHVGFDAQGPGNNIQDPQNKPSSLVDELFVEGTKLEIPGLCRRRASASVAVSEHELPDSVRDAWAVGSPEVRGNCKVTAATLRQINMEVERGVSLGEGKLLNIKHYTTDKTTGNYQMGWLTAAVYASVAWVPKTPWPHLCWWHQLQQS